MHRKWKNEIAALVALRSLARVETLENRRLLTSVPGIANLMLVNTQTGVATGSAPLATGATIDLGTTGRQLSVVAIPGAGAVGSVRFNYDGNPGYKVENFAPYAIAGDKYDRNGRQLLPWVPAVGLHSLVVTAYASSLGSGDRGPSLTVLFKVVDASPAPVPIRINAGGPAFTDARGDAFAADHFFTGGMKSTVRYNVLGTTDDLLYQSARSGPLFSFSEEVSPGAYTLTLRFADPVATRPRERLFDVYSDSTLLLRNFDIFTAAGAARTAVDRSFSVYLPNGHVHLTFYASHGSAIVSAVELIPADRAPVVPAPFYINAGGNAFTDSVVRPFEADNGFTGGTTGVTTSADTGNAISQAFATFREGSAFAFNRAVADGRYELWLQFSDPLSTPGQRVFNVSAEGTPILSGFDIAAQAADPNALAYGITAVTEAFGVTVADGQLNLSFQGVVGNAMISAVIVLPTDIPAAALPYSIQTRSEAVKIGTGLSNLSRIGYQILNYSNDHHEHYPASFTDLFAEQGDSIAVYASPRSDTLIPRGELTPDEKLAWVNSIHDYIYIGAGLRGNELPTIVVAYENPARVPGDLNVLYDDGSVGTVTRQQLAAMVPGSLDNIVEPTAPTYPTQTVDTKIVQSAIQLQTIASAMQFYANDFQSRFPPDFGTIFADAAISLNTFVDPRGPTVAPVGLSSDQGIAFVNNSTDYIYNGKNLRPFSPADSVLAYENPADNANGILILFADGRVEFREMRWALETIARVTAV